MLILKKLTKKLLKKFIIAVIRIVMLLPCKSRSTVNSDMNLVSPLTESFKKKTCVSNT